MVAALALTLTAGLAQAQYKTQAQTPTPAPAPAVTAAPAAAPAVTLTPSPAAPDPSAEAKRISRDEAIKMVKQGKAVWVDVRSKEQYDIGHIPGAISIPLGDLPNRWKDLPLKKYLIAYCA